MAAITLGIGPHSSFDYINAASYPRMLSIYRCLVFERILLILSVISVKDNWTTPSFLFSFDNRYFTDVR